MLPHWKPCLEHCRARSRSVPSPTLPCAAEGQELLRQSYRDFEVHLLGFLMPLHQMHCFSPALPVGLLCKIPYKERNEQNFRKLWTQFSLFPLQLKD